MNSLDSVSVWFACKLCNSYLSNVEDFIEHKKDVHFTEFQKTRCIVLEERSVAVQRENSVAVAAPRVAITEEQVPFNIDLPTNNLVDRKTTRSGQKNTKTKDTKDLKNALVYVRKLTPEEIKDACCPDLENVVKVEEPLVSDFDLGDFDPEDDGTSSSFQFEDSQPANKSTLSFSVAPSKASKPVDFDCKLCFEKLNSEAELRTHVDFCARVNNDHNRYCLDCNKLLAKAENYRNHRLAVHATDEEKAMRSRFTCHICSRKFLYKKSWKQHVETHKPLAERDNPFECQFCDRSFPTRSNLSSHLKSHSSEKPFKCPHENCRSAYKFIFDLRRHLTLHSDDTPFSCTMSDCDKAFKNQRQLRLHLDSHARQLLTG